jgi:mRNA-degrading endonuclease toxin of MazEF toxin-antitoxin module
MTPPPGEVWLANLGFAAKTRPVVIVSRHDPDPPRALVLYVPLTTKTDKVSTRWCCQHSPFLTVLPSRRFKASGPYVST